MNDGRCWKQPFTLWHEQHSSPPYSLRGIWKANLPIGRIFQLDPLKSSGLTFSKVANTGMATNRTKMAANMTMLTYFFMLPLLLI